MEEKRAKKAREDRLLEEKLLLESQPTLGRFGSTRSRKGNFLGFAKGLPGMTRGRSKRNLVD